MVRKFPAALVAASMLAGSALLLGSVQSSAQNSAPRGQVEKSSKESTNTRGGGTADRSGGTKRDAGARSMRGESRTAERSRSRESSRRGVFAPGRGRAGARGLKVANQGQHPRARARRLVPFARKGRLQLRNSPRGRRGFPDGETEI